MSSYQEMVNTIKDDNGIGVAGYLRLTGRMRAGVACDASDIVGFDYLIVDEDGGCWQHYAANAPYCGLTQAVPAERPLGIEAFNTFNVTYDNAIAAYLALTKKEPFVAISLCMPLTEPEAKEPFWYIRGISGNEILIGAIQTAESGTAQGNVKYAAPMLGTPQANSLYAGPTAGVKYMGPPVRRFDANMKYMGPTVVKYMGPNVKYMGPTTSSSRMKYEGPTCAK